MNWKEKLKQIQLIVLDIDGTLTDGGMYYTADGDYMKRFHVQDGMGITLLKKAGFKIAFLTSENSPIVKARAKKLGIEHVILGCQQKKISLQKLSEELGLPLMKIAYMGDDVNDEAPMSIAGVKVCPSNATPRVRSMCDYVCQKAGGHGALREFAELLLEAQNKSNTLPDIW